MIDQGKESAKKKERNDKNIEQPYLFIKFTTKISKLFNK
jgi:hypothetical protein